MVGTECTEIAGLSRTIPVTTLKANGPGTLTRGQDERAGTQSWVLFSRDAHEAGMPVLTHRDQK